MGGRVRMALAGGTLVAVGLGGWAWATGQDGPPPPPPPPRHAAAADADRVPTTRPLPPLAAGERRVAVRFDGGHDTDGRDRGRPVGLIAAALAVPADVFRQTFTHVHPAGPGSGPTAAEARANKAALLAGLAPYGVTNDRLDVVSDYYRYERGRDSLWRHRPAVAYAVVGPDGKPVRFDVADAGAGYTTAPTAAVDGLGGVTATLAFGTDLATNGSVQSLAWTPPGR